jgi:hypothetical protein
VIGRPGGAPFFLGSGLITRGRGLGQEAGGHLVGEVTEVVVDLDLDASEAGGVSGQLIAPLSLSGIDLMGQLRRNVVQGDNKGTGLGSRVDLHRRLARAGGRQDMRLCYRDPEAITTFRESTPVATPVSTLQPEDGREVLAAARGDRYGRPLSLLRRRVQPTHLHQGWPAHRYRGRPAQPHQRGHALPQGFQRSAPGRQPAPREECALPGASLRQVGDPEPRLGARADRPPRQGGARCRLHDARSGGPHAELGAEHGDARRRDAEHRGQLPDQEAVLRGTGVVSVENQART